VKNIFALTSLVLSAGYALVLAAQFAGVLPFSVFNVPVIISWSAAIGLLALAAGDGPRHPTYDAPRVSQASPQTEKDAPPVAAGAFATWGFHSTSS
jgi:hypothetical protein